MSNDVEPCPITREEVNGDPHVCIWPTCKLNTAMTIYNKAIQMFNKKAIDTTLRGYFKSAKWVEKSDGMRGLFPDNQSFCRCNECCRAVVTGSAKASALLHLVSALQEVLSR